ncbi:MULTISPECIES: DUF6355 family natural product biosynthesis protein [unclassified Streptomyces]|uniref:DUF6355 family natural product biosynthesis protein n=1 Tax=unclassified Streptomyces TaxID=2593676 RepID=UPI002DD9959D|nr:DUF6355 family natural product biosynthesis protein [Streptomyces sp. NBC_01237]WRZ70264.1 DUF6355 family natural product biosynthesis protein [Streptomyces sp. NBC_01237]
MNLRQSKVVGLAAAVMLTLGITGTAASTAAAAPSGVRACGWDPDNAAGIAYYRHCATSGKIWIRVERHNDTGYTTCVGPGRTPLGSTAVIKYAWYTGSTC